MTAAVEQLDELALYTPEKAAEILSGETPGAVSGYWLREQIRDGRFDYTPMGRRIMLSRAQIAEIIRLCCVPATTRAPRRKIAV